MTLSLACPSCHSPADAVLLSQDATPSQVPPQGLTTQPSQLAAFINNNQQTPAGISPEERHRYITCPDNPSPQFHHGTESSIIAAYKAKAQAAIDAFDAAINK
jgi:hypothetical protein